MWGQAPSRHITQDPAAQRPVGEMERRDLEKERVSMRRTEERCSLPCAYGFLNLKRAVSSGPTHKSVLLALPGANGPYKAQQEWSFEKKERTAGLQGFIGFWERIQEYRREKE